MNYYQGIEEIQREPLTDAESVSNWLAIACDGARLPYVLRNRSAHDTLDGVSLPELLAIVLDAGICHAARVRAANLIGEQYLATLN